MIYIIWGKVPRFKNPGKLSPMGLIWTNFPKLFINTTVEAGLSDFHKLTLTILKMQKSKSKS